jgi:hypothetical protein
VCQSHTGRLTGFWFLLNRPKGWILMNGLLKYPIVGSGVSVNPPDSPSMRSKFWLNCLHWHRNAINIRSRTQEDITVPSYLDAVFREISIRFISLVKKHIFDLVWLHIAWIKFYMLVLKFLNSAHTLHCYLCQFSPFNKTFGRQNTPISSSIKMWCEVLSMWFEKVDEPFSIVLRRTDCVKRQNIF